MKHNNLGRFILVICIILWSLYQVYPPTSRDLLVEFSSRAQNQDATFKAITAQASAYQRAGTNNEFIALQTAIGTNDIQRYFSFIRATNQIHPNTFILNRLQRDASGKIKLGLDLQGGTSFLVEMDTNRLVYVETVTNSSGAVEVVTNMARTEGALSQAVEVLRKRVDAFGVAEPIIQPAGGNRILIQLPGLSHEAKESA